MASLDTTPVRELTDSELRKRLLVLGYDVPVSVNREFLEKKLENASAGGGGSKTNKRHSVAASSPSSSSRQGGRESPSAVRKRKSLAATPSGGSGSGLRGHNHASSPMSPLAASSPISPATPHYSSSASLSINTPSTPSPFVSRLNTPSPPTSPLNNGETGSHSPRYLNYYNLFKSGGDQGHSSRTSGGDEMGNYNYGYNNRSIRLSPPGTFSPVTSVAPPSRSAERNGYAGGASGTNSVESDWFGGHLVSKILLALFALFFIIIGVLYVRQSMSVDPRGLAGSVGTVGEKSSAKPQPSPSPPVKKQSPTLPTTSMNFPICGLKGVDPEACIPKTVVKDSRTLFNTLKEELTQRAKWKGCRPDVQDRITLKEARTILYRLTDLKKTDVDVAFQGMLLLVTENPRAGMALDGELFTGLDITSKDVAELDLGVTNISVTDISSYFMCEVVALLTSTALYLTIAAAFAGFGYGGWKLVLMYRRRKKSEEKEVFEIVEKVQELLYQQYELSEKSQGTVYLAVNHIRDELVPPKERQKKEALWNKVVDYISNHESRVREEVQHISGEEFRVWRWLPTASPLTSKRFSMANKKTSRFSMPSGMMMSNNLNPGASPAPVAAASSTSIGGPSMSPQSNLYPSLNDFNSADDADGGNGIHLGDGDNNSNMWQGQAFETCEGSPNALPITPTTCLKIRHMFTEKDGTVAERTRIQHVILEKCRNARILHIGIDSTSVEGCVYVRCSTKEDARAAFLSLHGWWFDGHLLSVKFLREERYFSRFPDARNCRIPLSP